ncbi:MULTISPECIES: helix-turn-helix transcriptional regulator [unclassified Rhizobium]|uniref:helix-turn-helix transcriptional regulator n=1 Tax=unclassified Rhizobium TaxID=2613769 RepID=UPI0006F82D01|nr:MULTISPECIES: helix-turn-helix transcriptional regulator [unclassified Rhizobium]KQV44387.1 hypothetical protein ASC86_06405 [Rhizobium sp. Root1212]KRD38568.1 hypothetical protein ASE37_06405 [Rhizobium sp. Root268]
MRVRTDSLYKALDTFQEAALDPARWRSTITAVSEACGAFGANIMEPRSGGAFGGVLYSESLDRGMEDYVGEEWHRRDGRARLIVPSKQRGVVLEQDFMAPDEENSVDFYRFLAKHRLRDAVMMDVSAEGDDLYFVLQGRIEVGGFSHEDMSHFHAIRTRFMSAAQLMRHFSTSRNGGMAAAFETARIGCLFFDRNGRVVLANPKAESLLQGGPVLANGQIKAIRPAEGAAFNKALQAVTDQAPAQPGAPEVVTLSRLLGRPLMVRFQRLGEQFSDIFNPAAAMALIEDPDAAGGLAPETLSTLFGLTPAEARIALILSNGTSAVDIAGQTGLAYETVRSHIRAIFRKTETGRQSELSALFSRIRL